MGVEEIVRKKSKRMGNRLMEERAEVAARMIAGKHMIRVYNTSVIAMYIAETEAYEGDGFEPGIIYVQGRGPELLIGTEEGCVKVSRALCQGMEFDSGYVNIAKFLDLEELEGKSIEKSNLWILQSPIEGKVTKKRDSNGSLACFYVKKPLVLSLEELFPQYGLF